MNDNHLHALIFGVVLSLASTSEPAHAGESTDYIGDEALVSADTVALSDVGTYRARGDVQLALGDLSIQTEWAVLEANSGEVLTGPLELEVPGLGTMKASSGRFDTLGQLELNEPVLSLLATGTPVQAKGHKLICRGGFCSLTKGEVTPCPHPDPGYSLKISQAIIHESGDLDLHRPTLYLGRTPVFALPWVRLRPPGSPGFTSPILGYTQTAGFIAGPAGQFPVGDEVMLSGHVAGRTSQGLETSTNVEMPGAAMSLDHLLDGTQNYMRARSDIRIAGEHASLAMDLDLATHRTAVDELEPDPLARAVPYLRNRMLFSSSSKYLHLETGGAYQQAFGPSGSRVRRLFAPTPFASVFLMAPQALGILSPEISLAASHFSAADGHLFEAARGLSPSHTAIFAAPSISADNALGILATELAIGTSHRLWLTDDGESKDLHSLQAGLKIGLPLVGRPFGTRHLVAPYVSYYAHPWTNGSGPSWIMSPQDRAGTGHQTDMGIETEFGSFERPAASLLVFQRFILGGFGKDAAPAFIHGRFTTGPHWLRTTSAATYDQTLNQLSATHLDLSSGDLRGNSISLGLNWYGDGDGPHLQGSFPSFSEENWTTAPDSTLELKSAASVRLTQKLTVFGESRVGIYPIVSMNALVYGLTFGSNCGCVRVGLTASHRLDEPVPDLFATLNVLGF